MCFLIFLRHRTRLNSRDSIRKSMISPSNSIPTNAEASSRAEPGSTWHSGCAAVAETQCQCSFNTNPWYPVVKDGTRDLVNWYQTGILWSHKVQSWMKHRSKQRASWNSALDGWPGQLDNHRIVCWVCWYCDFRCVLCPCGTVQLCAAMCSYNLGEWPLCILLRQRFERLGSAFQKASKSLPPLRKIGVPCLQDVPFRGCHKNIALIKTYKNMSTKELHSSVMMDFE